MLGAPGAGKGTQAARLAEAFGLVHISTGDIFRANLSQGTPLGRKAQEYMDRGDLVPDDVTVAMVKDRLGAADVARGFILDGFPRTLPQAEALDRVLAERDSRVDCAVYLKVPDAVLVDRLTGRRVCPSCGANYHARSHPPKREGVCDVCGAALTVRPDDREATVKKRLAVFHQSTAPLIDYYRDRGALLKADGEGSVDAVTGFVVSALKQRSRHD